MALLLGGDFSHWYLHLDHHQDFISSLVSTTMPHNHENSSELLALWAAAFASFQASFDTRESQRTACDAGSWETRKRMKGFDQKLREFLITQGIPVKQEVPAGIPLVFAPHEELFHFFSPRKGITP